MRKQGAGGMLPHRPGRTSKGQDPSNPEEVLDDTRARGLNGLVIVGNHTRQGRSPGFRVQFNFVLPHVRYSP